MQREEKFINYNRSNIGASGVPLSCIIQKNKNLDTDINLPDFINKTIACAPLKGSYFSEYCLTVFNMIVYFKIRQPYGYRIKGTIKYVNGRRFIKSLLDQFSGERNEMRNTT